MKKKFKIIKGEENVYNETCKIHNWVWEKIRKDLYDKKKKHYVDNIQKNIIIEVTIIRK